MSDPSQARLVTFGLIDGRTKVGRLGKFSATMPDLTIEVVPPPARPPLKEAIAAERVAYIAYHRAPGESPKAAHEQAQRYKVYVPGGKVFHVVELEGTDLAVGFRALPTDASCEFAEFFFYKHGISAKEKDALLGEMLLVSGALGPQALESAIVQQNAGRTVPIGQILVEQKKVTDGDIVQATSLQKRRNLRIGEVLVEAGIATQQDIEAALSEQKKRRGKRLGEVLVELNVISELMLTQTLAKKFELPFVDLDQCILNPKAAAEIPRDTIAKYVVLPVDTDATSLTVAISDPLALEALDVLRFQANRRIDEVLVVPSQLKRHVAAYLSRAQEPALPAGGLDQIIKKMAESAPLELDNGNDDDAADDGEQQPADGNVVNLVNHVVIEAYRAGASDIHIEPNGPEQPTRLRFRIDGECVASHDIPAQYRSSVVARIKIMAKLDIAERRKPQDGKIRFKLGDRQIELRVATLPTVNNNEDVVMRILANSKPLALEELRLSERNLRELKLLVQKPYGLLLCVGPTGSGKTTTLHSALGHINTVDTKIWTAEDPVEITQPGLRQTQVNNKIGFTFATAMRAFLRADPDVIMVGEMRDHETASTGIEASLTGHLVLSTLHTNSAPETVTRLLDMGLDPFSFGDALLGVLAQRLARSLCGKCKQPDTTSPEEFSELAELYGAGLFEKDFDTAAAPELRLYRAKGCEVCGNTGYKGRVGVHELLVTNDAIKHALVHKSGVEEIRRMAIETGMRTLLQDGIAKVLQGHTDLKQILAVCSR